MNERIQKLKEQIRELMEWKRQNSIQQIPFNPSVNTKRVMHQNHFEYIPVTSIGVQSTKIAIEVSLDGTLYYFPAFQSTIGI